MVFALLALMAVAEAPPFEAPEAPPVTEPAWVHLPTGEDMARALPLRAKSGGRAVIECRVAAGGQLQRCRIVDETPPGQDFGRAALRISTKFRMKPQDRAGQPTAGRLIRLPIAWNLPPTAPN